MRSIFFGAWILPFFAFTSVAQDFAAGVKLVLEKRCWGCHNETNRSSGLSLQSKESIRIGGNRGPAAGHIVDAIAQTGPLKMPPGGKLPAAEAEMLISWAKADFPGLPDPPASQKKSTHWAFLPPRRGSGTIDSFINAELMKAGLTAAPLADRATLLRRVHLDITGLPPTPQQIDAFVSDTAPDAYARRVDELLASPHYGERWARHWLDQVRYADSDGGSRDEPRQIWKYRDYVVEALNKDKPFNQFVVEQLAGDLLPNASPEQITATGMQRNSLLQIEAGTDRDLYRSEAVADRVDTLGTVFLGLSTGCARCHDHKFDPISQREYYQLFAFFNSVDEYSNSLPPFSDTQDLSITHQPLQALGSPDEVRKYEALRSMILALQKEKSAYLNGRELNKAAPELQIRNDAIRALEKQLPGLPVTMVMRELPEPRATHILLGGDYQRPGIAVQPAVLSSFHPLPAKQERLTRLDLAKWIADPANPLLARVTVNRIWQHYFGLGLVETENDFGRMGSRPSHPELLDWLAVAFVEKGWSQKAVHRAIVLSETYRRSSVSRPAMDAKDPRNRLLSRQNRLRLDAEIIRDSALAVSGLLYSAQGGPTVYPPQPEGAMVASQVKKTWTASIGKDRFRRGLYTHNWRITPHPAAQVFDAPLGMAACTRRPRSNTPLQALTLMNGAAFHEMAQAFGRRIIAEGGPTAESRVRYAFQLAHGRKPSDTEAARLLAYVNAEADQPSDPSVAWFSLARVLFNTDEFITRE